jgi:hypothetical protein
MLALALRMRPVPMFHSHRESHVALAVALYAMVPISSDETALVSTSSAMRSLV